MKALGIAAAVLMILESRATYRLFEPQVERGYPINFAISKEFMAVGDPAVKMDLELASGHFLHPFCASLRHILPMDQLDVFILSITGSKIPNVFGRGQIGPFDLMAARSQYHAIRQGDVSSWRLSRIFDGEFEGRFLEWAAIFSKTGEWSEYVGSQLSLGGSAIFVQRTVSRPHLPVIEDSGEGSRDYRQDSREGDNGIIVSSRPSYEIVDRERRKVAVFATLWGIGFCWLAILRIIMILVAGPEGEDD